MPSPALRIAISLLILAALAGLLGGPGLRAAPGEGSPTTLFLRYELDRSAVPAWVTHRELTLRLQVGTASEVWAWGDGRPLPVRHDPTAGLAWVTTDATEVIVALRGIGLEANTLGGCEVTPLKEDKLWAYSMTFDDGRLSVYQYAYPELRRYGYRAAVAVIGEWLTGGRDPLAYGYCGPAELAELIAAGWSIFNHSYYHSQAPSDITLDNAWRGQMAIRIGLDGYRCTVFTVPYTSDFIDPLWISVIDPNADFLDLRLMQLTSAWGGPMMPVDGPLVLGQGTYHMGRYDIGQWRQKDYFGRAHQMATARPQQHPWLSLHGHEVTYEQDWCAVSESAAYLYHTYGAGGTDEVWVAPADEVFQYWVARSYTRVNRTVATPQDLGPLVRGPLSVTYRQGVAGFNGWSDTHIQEGAPGTNYVNQQKLYLRGNQGERSTILLRVELTPPFAGATVEHAVLHLYASDHTNATEVDLAVYGLARDWLATEATWLNARQGVAWGLSGARLVGADREGQVVDRVHVGCTTAGRWYAFDVTDLVAAWVAHPEQNHGLLIEGPQSIAKGIWFASANYYDPALRPLLQVVYGPPAPQPTATPTPTPTPVPTLPPTPTPTEPAPRWLFLPLLRR